MRVDSFAFLPRSFREMYESPVRLPGEDTVAWAPFGSRLADSCIGLVTSAGAYVTGTQPSFDLEGERRRPTWGDPSWRAIPHGAGQGTLSMAHLHVNSADAVADHEVVLPSRALDALVSEGVVGAAAQSHASVMGYQEAGLAGWRNETGPAVVEHFRRQNVDGVVFAPV